MEAWAKLTVLRGRGCVSRGQYESQVVQDAPELNRGPEAYRESHSQEERATCALKHERVSLGG